MELQISAKRDSTRMRSSAACWSTTTSRSQPFAGSFPPPVLPSSVEMPRILMSMYFLSTCAMTCAFRSPSFVSFPNVVEAAPTKPSAQSWAQVLLVDSWAPVTSDGIGADVSSKTGFFQF